MPRESTWEQGKAARESDGMSQQVALHLQVMSLPGH